MYKHFIHERYKDMYKIDNNYKDSYNTLQRK